MEKFQQEIPVEGLELVFTSLLLHPFEAIREIIAVTIERLRRFCIEEALALDEIDEHQAVQHQRSVPFAVALRRNVCDKLQESRVFKFETVIEFLCDALYIESLCDTPHHFQGAQLIFFIDSNDQRFKFLRQSFAGLPFIVAMQARGRWFALLALNPLPDLGRLFTIRIDNDMFIRMFDNFTLNFTQQGIGNNVTPCIEIANVDLDAALLYQRTQAKVVVFK